MSIRIAAAALAVIASCPVCADCQAGGAPTEDWYNTTDDGVNHYVLELGREAEPRNVAVVLHGGWGAEHSYLIDALEPVADSYRFVLYDQRGSLRTPVKDPSTITIARLVADLEDLRASIGLERMTLVAHSMGNTLAYAYLAEHPDRVRGLVLLGAVPPALLGGDDQAFFDDVWPGFGAADKAAMDQAKREFNDHALERATALWRKEGLIPEALRDMSLEEMKAKNVELAPLLATDKQRTNLWRIHFTTINTFSGDNWRQMKGGMAFYNPAVANAIQSDAQSYRETVTRFWPALSDFKGPIRILMGTHDYVDLGPTLWPRIVRRLADAELTVIQNAGHSSWMDRPEEFAAALRRALGSATR